MTLEEAIAGFREKERLYEMSRTRDGEMAPCTIKAHANWTEARALVKKLKEKAASEETA